MHQKEIANYELPCSGNKIGYEIILSLYILIFFAHTIIIIPNIFS